MRAGFIILLAFWLNSFPARAAALSLAIIAEDETAGPAADLLVAELSGQPDLRLLERAELQRIVAEQSLSLASSQGLLRAGRLAGADALLFLDHFTRPGEEGNRPAEFLGLRLILVGPGVLLHTVEFNWPAPDISEWSSTTARNLEPHLARAGVPEGAGLKLSLLNLRSPTDSRESRLLDRELNVLLLKRLARETNVFVLERQKLGATLLERELNRETSPFWRGSYLIDGTVNKLGFSTNAITIEGRVTPPGGTTTNLIELSGRRSELPQLVDKLVREILQVADRGTTTGSWDPAAEARRYFEEARWSLRWGLLSEAQSAADAAWALGQQDEAVALARVQAYGRAAEPEAGSIYVFPQRRRKHFEKPPRPESLQSGITALSIFLEWSARVPVEKAGKEWLSTGLQALQNASELLHRYYFMAEARLGLEEDLAELRALCRDTAAWLARVPSVRAPFFIEDPAMSFDEINSALERDHLFRTIAEFAGFWQDRITDAIPLHRMLITAPSFGIIRRVYLHELDRPVPLAGWTWNERKNALPLWRNLLGELEQSSNVVVRIEAKILQSMNLSSDEKLYAHIREILRLIREHAPELGNHPSPLHYEYHLGDLIGLGSNRVTPEREALSEEIRRAQDGILKSIREDQWLNAKVRKQHAVAARLFDGQKQFLQERRTDPLEFMNLFPPFTVFPKEQVQTLLGMLPEYRTGLSNLLETVDRREQGRFRIALSRSTQLEAQLNSMLGKATPPLAGAVTTSANQTRPAITVTNIVPAATNQAAGGGPHRPGSRPPIRPGMPPHLQRGPGPFARGGPGAMQEPFVLTPIRTNALVIGSFQPIPTNILHIANLLQLQNTGFVVDGDRLWLRTRYINARLGPGFQQQAQGGAMTLFDPRQGVLESIPTGFELPLYFTRFNPMQSDFQFWKGDLYAAGGRQLRRWDRASKEWRALPVPLSKEAQLYALDGRLLMLNAESLLELEPGGAGVKTLASSRRHPPLTPLDAVTNLSAGALFAAAEGFRVWVPPSLYQFKDGSFSIVETFKSVGPPAAVPRDPGAFLYVQTPGHSERRVAYWMRPADAKPAPLFTQLSPWDTGHYKPARGLNEVTNSLWQGLDQFRFDVESAVFAGDDILMWGNPVHPPLRGGINRPSSIHPALEMKSYLFLLSRRFKEPVVFAVEMGAGLPSLWASPKPGHLPPRVFMTATRDHLVFGNHEQLGLWFVPLADLAKAAESAKLAEDPGGAP